MPTTHFKWLCGLWLGAMLFFTGAVTPALFTSFDKLEAGRIVAVLFPNYYLANHVAFLLVLLSGIFAVRSRQTRGGLAAITLIVLAWLIGPALNQLWLAPFLRELKTAGNAVAFSKWHGLSMLLNFIAILLVALAPWLVNESKSAGYPAKS